MAVAEDLVHEGLAGVREEALDPTLGPRRVHAQERLGDGVLRHRLGPVAQQHGELVQALVVRVVQRLELVPPPRRAVGGRGLPVVAHGRQRPGRHRPRADRRASTIAAIYRGGWH